MGEWPTSILAKTSQRVEALARFPAWVESNGEWVTGMDSLGTTLSRAVHCVKNIPILTFSENSNQYTRYGNPTHISKTENYFELCMG